MYNSVENGPATTGLPTRHINTKKRNQNGETKSEKEKETKNQSAKWPLK